MNKELHEKIARLEAELEEMKKIIDGRSLKPKDGQKYWFISGSGEVYENQWLDHTMDRDCYAIGNCFTTEQEAEDKVRVLKLIQKARETQDGFVPDWNNWIQCKYRLYFDNECKEVRVMSYQLLNQDPTLGYWKDKSECEKFIRDNHDELLWFFTEYRR